MLNIHYNNADIGLNLDEISMYFFNKVSEDNYELKCIFKNTCNLIDVTVTNEETKNFIIKKLTGCSDVSKECK